MTVFRGGSGTRWTGRLFFRLLFISQALALALNPLLALHARAEVLTPGSLTNTASSAQSNFSSDRFIAQTPSTVLPTDVVPLPAAQERMSFGENLQLRILQRLPARFYFNASCETSLRYETNVFQFPTKRKFLSQIFQTTPPPIFRLLNGFQQKQILDTIGLCGAEDLIFRVLPNVSGGWTITPRTRVFANYFMIRDQLAKNIRLNTVIHSVAGGIQQDIPVTRKGNLQLEFQCRELYQLHSQPVFDFLPAATFSYILTPRTVCFVNTLLQLRGKKPFQAPTREIDPFYTFGFLYQRGGWSFSSTATFVQNFREPFRKNASIPVNNYSWICDFELARRLIKQLPGLQAFVRAEPIWNFHSHNRPGLAGMDFRLFWGARFSLGKPPLTAALEQIRQQLEEQEGTPPPAQPPGKQPAEPKPSAFLMPYQLIAGSPQPIHGFLNPIVDASTGKAGHADNLAVLHPAKQSPFLHSAFAPATDSEALPAVLNTVAINSAPAAESLPDKQDAIGAPLIDLRSTRTTEPKSPIIAMAPVAHATARISDEASAVIQKQAEPVPAAWEEEFLAIATPAACCEPAADDERSLSSTPVAPAVHEDRSNLPTTISYVKRSQEPKRDKRIATRLPKPAVASTAKPREVEMVLVPPLPSVNPDAPNPFENSGLEIKAPAVFTGVR